MGKMGYSDLDDKDSNVSEITIQKFWEGDDEESARYAEHPRSVPKPSEGRLMSMVTVIALRVSSPIHGNYIFPVDAAIELVEDVNHAREAALAKLTPEDRKILGLA